MKQKKNYTIKIVAAIALGAIIIWIIGTGALAIFSSFSHNQWNTTQISEEQLQEYIDAFSGSTITELEDNNIQTWSELEATIDIQTEIDISDENADIIESISSE